MMIAKYIRLSSADEDARYGDKPESNSVTHQRMLLTNSTAGISRKRLKTRTGSTPNVVNAFLPTPFTAMLNHRRTAGC